MPATKAPIRDTKGRSQDPIDFFWRAFKLSPAYDQATRNHVRTLVTRIRREPFDLERRLLQASNLRSYAEALRIGESMQTMTPGSLPYKHAVWSFSKMSEVMKRMTTGQGLKAKHGTGQQVRHAAPMRPREDTSQESPSPEPEARDTDAA